MAFNIFKKKPLDKAQDKQEEAKKVPVSEPKEVKKAPKKIVGVSVLSLPHVTEKAGLLQGQNQYIFKVIPGSTKYGVRDSVEAQYGVQVVKIRIINVHGKSIRVGKNMGKKPGYKKAIVTLKEGHTIESNV